MSCEFAVRLLEPVAKVTFGQGATEDRPRYIDVNRRGAGDRMQRRFQHSRG